jgi:tRNA-binding protein
MMLTDFIAKNISVVNNNEFVKSRHSREGGNPGAHNFLKRMDSRLRTSGMTAIKRTSCDVVNNRTMINFDDFKKLEIRIGKILSAEKVEGTDKLLKLEIDFGMEKRQIVAGIAETYQPEQLIGKEVPVLMNLEPRTIRGVESQGMILAASVDGKPRLLHPDEEVPPGCEIR